MQLRKFFEFRPLGEFSGGDGASRQNVDKAGQNVLKAILSRNVWEVAS